MADLENWITVPPWLRKNTYFGRVMAKNVNLAKIRQKNYSLQESCKINARFASPV